jgi:hypothetical protein
MYIASHPLPAGFKIATVRLSSLKDDSDHAIEQSADLLKRFKVTRLHTHRLVACTRPTLHHCGIQHHRTGVGVPAT